MRYSWIIWSRPDNQNSWLSTKKRTGQIEDFAIPADHKVKMKESQKKEKYLDLATELEKKHGGHPPGVMVKAMDCGIVVSEFVLQLRYYVHFRANTHGKGMNRLILPTMG